MSRDLTSDALAAVTAETVMRTVCVELDYDSGTVRLAGSQFDIAIGGNTFLGVGALGAIAEAEEGSELQSYSMALSLSGIPRDSVATALTEPYQGRAATVWEVPLNPATMQPIDDPIVIFKGRMDTMAIEMDAASATVTISVTNRLADWERQRLHLFSDEEQQRLNPGDLGLQYAASIVNMQIIWPTSQGFQDYARKHPNG